MQSNWIFKNSEGPAKALALSLSKELKMHPISTTVCVNRGLKTADEIRTYLNPRLDHLTHPFKILDLEKAVDHILEIQGVTKLESVAASGKSTATEFNGIARKKMRVYTDYDVDGTTGAALLTWFFRDLKFNFDVFQPDRFKDGYGLNVPAVEQAHADGVHTLITVDCGITNFDAANKARELGIQLIVVDHHLIDPVKGIPEAFAVIDPQRADDESGLKQLCGCALGFYLCMGLRIKARELNYFASAGLAEPNLKSLLDLVVIATAADMVPLTGDNRILVRHGLEILKNTTKPGLRSLMEKAGVEVKTVSASNLGFALGPRINASGRMGSAETAYQVLTTTDREVGEKLAQELETINKQRQEVQMRIWDQARALIDKGIEAGKFSHAVVVASPDWHEGVVGIVASKVTEHFKMPAIVLAVREDGIVKGSVRSYGGHNVLEALHLSKQFLNGYGGHKFAAGLTLQPEKLEEFITHYNQMIAELRPVKKDDVLLLEGECTLDDLQPAVLEELEKLAPFGPGNPEPVFALTAKIETQSILKGRHVKIQFLHDRTIEGIWFSAGERIEYTLWSEKAARSQVLCRFAGIPEINRFRGRVTPSFRIKTVDLEFNASPKSPASFSSN
jgi:single-stranded-DNA-specific exonuclease